MGKNFLIECACGCGGIRHFVDKTYTKRIHIFIAGHNSTGKRANNLNWKGGRRKHEGYWLIYMPDHHFHQQNGYIMEHRLVYEEHGKCCLLPWAACHHIDGNKENNDIQNLVAMMRVDHTKLENKKGAKAIIFCSGNVPWNKGKPWSEEAKRKIREARWDR
jgi:hypothetical protein